MIYKDKGEREESQFSFCWDLFCNRHGQNVGAHGREGMHRISSEKINHERERERVVGTIFLYISFYLIQNKPNKKGKMVQ